ncbi:hypothetical protein PBI_HARLEY_88 [Mycobacterium phage Harley]|uniref:Uncharacterized protein n=1 Tax=Mycobacterium phage Harley TaxID=2282909 RepID=A0A346FC23_9CAUD|nr:hypothetical protein I5H45_gp088 [Mycobacterium phage Harley]AXN53248.1 hypothetical protein PBI_HARLEY_88 [Mycobacterium phage Harley]
MTSELRDVLTEAIRKHQWGGDILGCGCGWRWPEERTYFCGEDERIAKAHAAHVADALRSLPGVAVIQLPEPDESRSMSGNPEWYEDSWYVRPDDQGIRVAIGRNHLKTGSAQRLATALLAAAVVAEGEDK